MKDLSEYDNDEITYKKRKNNIHYNEEEELISSEQEIKSSIKSSTNNNNESYSNLIEEEASEENFPASEKENNINIEEAEIGDLINEEEEIDNGKLNELLFCVQGIGKFIDKEKKIYEKNEFCEPSLRDIHRFLRRDDPQNPINKYALLEWDACNSDIIPCLFKCENDDKICSLCIVILVDLTENLSDFVERRQKLEDMIYELKQNIIRKGVIDLVGRILNDACDKLQDVKKLKEIMKEMEREEKRIKDEKENKKNNNENDNENNNGNNNKNNINNENNNKKNENDNENNNKNNENDNKNEKDNFYKNDDDGNNEIKSEKQNEKNEDNSDIEMKNEEEENIIKNEKTGKKEINLDTTEEDKIINKRKLSQDEIKYTRIIELILVFLKQVLSISNSSKIKETGENIIILLKKFNDFKIFEAINYFSSGFNEIQKNNFTETISSTLLALIYNITRLFTPQSIIDYSIPPNKSGALINNNNKRELQKLLEREREENLQRKMLMSSRGNLFGTRIQVIRPIDNSSFIVSNVSQLLNKNAKNYLNEKTNSFAQQKHIGNRKRTIFKNKKVPKSLVSGEVKMINDIKIKDYFSHSSEICSYEFNPIIIEIKKFLIQFMDICYNSFVEYFYFQMDREEELDKYDIYHLINVMTFFIEFNRLLNYDNIKVKDNKFNFERICLSLTPDMINCMYYKLYKEIMLIKEDERKNFLIYPIINYLKQSMYALFDSYKHSKDDDFNLTLNVKLQDCILTKDFTKIIKQIFYFYNEVYQPYDILYDCIEFSEVYFMSLDYFTKKREIKIEAKKKRKEINDEELLIKKFQEKKLNDLFEEENDLSSSDSDVEILKRDIDVCSEAKCLVDYIIINKIFLILKNTSQIDSFNLTNILIDIKNNDRNILKFLTKIIERISIKCKCYWIFFNIQYLLLFNTLLNNQYFINEKDFKSLRDVIEKIINEYFEILKTNKFLPIESLFQFNGISLVENIMCNYENKVNMNENNKYYGTIYDEEEENKEYIPDEGEEIYKPGDFEKYEIKKEKEKEKEKEVNSSKKKKKKKLIKKYKEEEFIDENNNNDSIIVHKAKIKWSKEDDELIVKMYFDLINEDKSNIDDVIFEIKNKLNKSSKKIKKRLHKLKVRKGRERAEKKINKIHLKKHLKIFDYEIKDNKKISNNNSNYEDYENKNLNNEEGEIINSNNEEEKINSIKKEKNNIKSEEE